MKRRLMLMVQLPLQSTFLDSSKEKARIHGDIILLMPSNSGAIRLCTARPSTSRSRNPGPAEILYTALPVSIVSLRMLTSMHMLTLQDLH